MSSSSIKRAETGHKILFRVAKSLAKYFEIPLLHLVVDPHTSKVIEGASVSVLKPRVVTQKNNLPSCDTAPSYRGIYVLLDLDLESLVCSCRSILDGLKIPYRYNDLTFEIVFVLDDVQSPFIDMFLAFIAALRRDFGLSVRLVAQVVRYSGVTLPGLYSSFAKCDVNALLKGVSSLSLSAAKNHLFVSRRGGFYGCATLALLSAADLDSNSVYSSKGITLFDLDNAIPLLNSYVDIHLHCAKLKLALVDSQQRMYGYTCIIEGAEGAGKSALVDELFRWVAEEYPQHLQLKFSVTDEQLSSRGSLLSALFFALAGLECSVSKAREQGQADSWLMRGVELGGFPHVALGDAGEMSLVTSLLASLTKENPVMVVIEGLHDLDLDSERDRSLLALFKSIDYDSFKFPLNVIMTTRREGAFVNYPTWLDSWSRVSIAEWTHRDLRRLHKDGCFAHRTYTALSLDRLQSALDQSDGNPRRLLGQLALLSVKQSERVQSDFSVFLTQHLTSTELTVLKVFSTYRQVIQRSFFYDFNVREELLSLERQGWIRRSGSGYELTRKCSPSIVLSRCTPAESVKIKHFCLAVLHFGRPDGVTYSCDNDTLSSSLAHVMSGVEQLMIKGEHRVALISLRELVALAMGETLIASLCMQAECYIALRELQAARKVCGSISNVIAAEPKAYAEQKMGADSTLEWIARLLGPVFSQNLSTPNWAVAPLIAVRCQPDGDSYNEVKRIQTLYLEGYVQLSQEKYENLSASVQGVGSARFSADLASLGGLIYYSALNADRAMVCARRAIAMSKTCTAIHAELESRLVVISVFLDLGDERQAETEISDAITLSEQLKTPSYLLFFLLTRVRLYLLLNEIERAISTLYYGLTIIGDSPENSMYSSVFRCLLSLIDVGSSVGYYDLDVLDSSRHSCGIFFVESFFLIAILFSWRSKRQDSVFLLLPELERMCDKCPTPRLLFCLRYARLVIGFVSRELHVSHCQDFNRYVETNRLNFSKIQL